MRSYRILFSIVVLAFSGLCLRAQDQEKADTSAIAYDAMADTSKIVWLAKMCAKYSNIAPDKALEYGQRGLALSIKINSRMGMAMCYTQIFTIYADRGDDENAWECIQRALKIFEDLGEKRGLANCYNGIAAVYQLQSKYSQALIYFQKSLAIDEAVGNKVNIAYGLNNIGILHKQMKNYELAMEYYTRSMEINEELNDRKGLSYNYMNIGTLTSLNGDYNKALEYFELAISVAMENGDKKIMAYCYNHIGTVQMKKNELDDALGYFKKALDLDLELQDKVSTSFVYSNMANVYMQRNDIDAAILYATKALELSEDTGHLPNRKEACQRLWEAYEKKGNPTEALRYFKKYETVKDSIQSEELSKKILVLEMDYNIEKREREINLLNAQSRNQELQLKINLEKIRNQRILFSSLTIILLVSLIALYSRYSHRQKEALNRQKLLSKKEQLIAVIHAQEKERVRFARDVHDGIGQYFTALKFKINSLENADQQIRMRNKETYEEIEVLVDDLYHEIRNISFNIMPQVMDLKGLIAAIEELIAKIYITCKIRIELDVYNLDKRLPSYLEISLYRIIQELLNNITKHSKTSYVHIQFTKHEGELNLMIEDNGDGYNTELLERSEGHGWKNIKSRIELINGTIDVDSQVGKPGTTTIINVPLEYTEFTDHGSNESAIGG